MSKRYEGMFMETQGFEAVLVLQYLLNLRVIYLFIQ